MRYLSPTSLPDALALMEQAGTIAVAGCTDFFPALGPGGSDRAMLDLTRIDAIRGISHTAEGWRIGAATRWSDVIRADLPAGFDALKAAAREVGSVQIQNAGTVAGNICNASPAADGMPPLLALGAEVELTAQTGTRRLPLAEFVTGIRRTALRPAELVTALHIPPLPEAASSAFEKLGSRKYLVISIVMVAANLVLRDGRVAAAQVAVGACSPVAQRLPALEARLLGMAPDRFAELDINAQDMAPLTPIDDVRGTSDYRRDAIAVLCRRALMRAAAPGGQPHGQTP